MRVANHDGTAFCEIDSLPGCSQIAVSHSAFVKPEARGQGVGKDFHHERLRLMEKNLGYDYAICTVDMSNTPQIKILAAENWLFLGSFRSSKTGHFVGIYGKPLTNLP
jgi:ribosomal protein S18 acetylase RimI-like enzyme